MNLPELIQQIDENQVKINAYGKFDEAILKKINYKFRLDWNYYSNRMEGGTLTRQETRSVMVGNISIEGKPLKDVMEMNGHDKVVLDILKIGKGEQTLSEKRVKEMHKAIMHEDDLQKAKEVGKWKSEPNEIINYKNEKISFAAPGEVKERMHQALNKANAQLDAFIKDKKDKHHPLFIAADFHLDYITIHPFYDGNGRTARIFTNLILIACGLPVIIIKDEHKDRYYQILADIQAYGGSPDLFYAFVAERVIESQTLILNALKGEEIEEVDDLNKRITSLKNKISPDDKVTENKTTDTIYKVLSNIAFPLFKEIEIKCKSLNDLFLDYNSKGIFNHNNQKFQIKSKDNSWDSVQQTWLENQFLSQKASIQSFEFEYTFHGFKKSIQSSLSTKLTFWFNDYYYLILPNIENHNNGLKKAYNDSLTEKEKNDIIKKTIEPILDQIEQFLETK